MPAAKAARSTWIALAVLAALACGDGPEGVAPADLIDRLAREPGLSPPEIAANTPIVLLVVGVEGTTVALSGPPIAQPGATLRLERALATRRTRPPVLWAVVTSADGGAVRYWCAADHQARVRSTIRDPVEGRRSGVHRRPGGAVSSVRVPFEPSGQLRFYRASGGLVATYRFGATAGEPLARETS